jgi:hypothetical protein
MRGRIASFADVPGQLAFCSTARRHSEAYLTDILRRIADHPFAANISRLPGATNLSSKTSLRARVDPAICCKKASPELNLVRESLTNVAPAPMLVTSGQFTD